LRGARIGVRAAVGEVPRYSLAYTGASPHSGGLKIRFETKDTI